jgi:drug/metabolite transporter (DMT)-like permease
MSKYTLSWFLLILLACIWGSSFILMKKGMFTEDGTAIFTSEQVGSLRMLIAALALLPISITKLKILNWKNVFPLAIVGFCGNFIPAFLFTYAETGISSGLAGMLNSFTPIFTIIIGFLFFKTKLTNKQIIGTVIGTLGIIALVLTGKTASLNGDWDHILAIVLATLLYAISLTTIKNKLSNFNSFEITSLAFLIIFPFSIGGFFLADTIQTFNSNPMAYQGIFYIIILSIVGTALAVILFNRIIAFSSALFASSVTYFIPIVAVLIGFTFGETINLWQVLSMLIVLSGVIIANISLKKSKS